MRNILADIQSGAYAEEWIEENANGRPNFNRWRQEGMNSEIEQVGKNLRRMMPWLNPREVKPGQGGA
jgi:ketol-acid reductoisomerase